MQWTQLHEVRLDALASLLNLMGGAVLAWDALGAPRRARLKFGQAYFEALRGTGRKPDSRDELEF